MLSGPLVLWFISVWSSSWRSSLLARDASVNRKGLKAHANWRGAAWGVRRHSPGSFSFVKAISNWNLRLSFLGTITPMAAHETGHSLKRHIEINIQLGINWVIYSVHSIVGSHIHRILTGSSIKVTHFCSCKALIRLIGQLRGLWIDDAACVAFHSQRVMHRQRVFFGSRLVTLPECFANRPHLCKGMAFESVE